MSHPADPHDPPADVTADVPAADAAEQATPAWLDDEPAETTDNIHHPSSADDVDEADAWDQSLPAALPDDDDYDYDTSDPDATGRHE